MPWTKEQLAAIETEGNNIIVSAGAGSGKTAVLTERVYQKLIKGTNINELLVLTFTNAAANSMKKKIKKRIKKDPSLKNQLDLIDGSFITTFDSFALSIVKKYHTYLNISHDISITDEVVINLEKKRILEEILYSRYENPSDSFKLLINNFCLKDDEELKNYLLNIYSKIELKFDKDDYLNNYFEESFTNEKIDLIIEEYINIIKSHIDNIRLILEDINIYFDGDYYGKVYDSVINLLNSKDYKEIKLHSEIKLPSVPKGTSEEGKEIKETLKKEIDIIKELTIYEDELEMKNELLSTKTNLEEIISILIELNKEITKYKKENELYNFTDIAHLSIKVIKENKDILEELKYSFKEIMIDEYQDTSDTQEEFISLIANNNVYMVGDIKQSIYRFRNANPYIFKNKYDYYQSLSNINSITDCNGIRIDLLKNFRSRSEVLDDINKMFNKVMDDTLGGANYQESHNMVFGNISYNEEGKTNQDYNLEVLSYNLDDKKYTNDEYEAFIIAKDIKEKVESNYLIYDKDEKKLHAATYNDFVILIDRSTSFDLYKEIFEYFGIPLTIMKDNDLIKDIDILVIKNLLKLLVKVKENSIDQDFIYSFISICRSFLYKISDSEIYDIYKAKSYKETSLYKKCREIVANIDNMSPPDFFLYVLDEFNYDEKLITLGNINNYLMNKEYLYNLIKDLSDTGKNIEEFILYLEDIFNNELNIQFKINTESTESVKIMTIHTSKGLEYPVCYFSGFKKKFNLQDVKARIFYDNKYGIVLPKVDNYYKDSILRTLSKINTTREEISEKIRLLYVGLTRAEEKMIIVLPDTDKEKDYKEVPLYLKENYRSFEDITNSINMSLLDKKTHIKLELTKDYQIKLNNKSIEDLYSDKDLLKVNELNIETNLIENKHFSKESIKPITKEEKDLLEVGTKVHEILEYLDFKNNNLNDFILDNYIKEKIELFLNSDLIKNNIDEKMYKEYEFIYNEEQNELHGIIDLLKERENDYIIIDYKLKNIDDSNYDKQLNGYRRFIKEKTNKEVLCYLYSIIDSKYREVIEK